MTIYSQWDSLSHKARVAALVKMDFGSLYNLADQLYLDDLYEDNDDAEYIFKFLFGISSDQAIIQKLASRIAKKATKKVLAQHGSFVYNKSNAIFTKDINFDPIFKDDGVLDTEIAQIIEDTNAALEKEAQEQEAWENGLIEKYAKSDIDRLFLKEAGYYSLQGEEEPQIPAMTFNLTADGPQYSSSSAVNIDLLEHGLIAWKTRKGWINTPECINPKTGRRLSGFLFITKKGLDIYGDALYGIYKEACEKKGLEYESREEWQQILTERINQKR